MLGLVLAAALAVALLVTLRVRQSGLPDFSGSGPFSVGVTTFRPGDGPVTEIWYPVEGASVGGLQSEAFDHRSVWPTAIRPQIPPDLFPVLDTGAFRDAPPSGQGPFPLVVFSHGFGGYRQMSSFYTIHLASWGFVVAAPDHEGRGFRAAIEGTARRSADNDLGDVRTVLEALADGRSSELAAVVDGTRIAVAGYSAGATTAVAAGDLEGVDTFIALSGRGALTENAGRKPALVFAEEDDSVIPAFVSELLYERMAGTARLVVIATGGHSALVDLCPAWTAASGQLGRLTTWLGSIRALANGCSPGYPEAVEVWKVLDHVSVAHLYDVFGPGDVGRGLSEGATEAVSSARLSVFATKP
ncbi:MAG TPA: dienelactone hydrolase family protein [Acidimicrobiia bacterium]|nr:dienelactone hydrolase family protein [Acidimicrobiia bacterium]